MANEDRIFHDAQGQIWFRAPGDRWQQVSRDEAEILMEGGVERFARSAGNTLGQLVIGGGALMEAGVRAVIGDETDTGARDMYRRWQDAQDVRTRGAPATAMAGALLGYAPDLLLGGESMIGRAGLRGTLEAGGEAALRSAPVGAARNPENPLQGAAVEALAGGLGAAAVPGAAALARGVTASPLTRRIVGVMDNVIRTADPERNARAGWFRPGGASITPEARATARAEIAAERMAARDLSAARTLDPDQGQGAARLLGDGFHDAETMMDRYDFPLSQAQGDLLDASDMTTFTAARRADDEARVRARTEPGLIDRVRNGPPTNFAELGRQQQLAVVKETAAQLGMPAELRLTPEKVGTRMGEISDEIDGLLERAPDVDGRNFMAEVGRYMQTEHITEPQADRLLERYAKQWTDYTDPETGQISSRDAAKVRNRLNDDIERVSRTASDTEAIEALAWLKQNIDRRMMADWDDEMRQDFVDLGRQWSLAKALFRGTDSMSARGDVQVGKLITALKGEDWMTKTGRRSDDYMRFLQTVEAATMKETADSGTPRGIAEMIANRVTGATPIIGSFL